MVPVLSQKSLFAKIVLFCDDFAPCTEVTDSLLRMTSCTKLLDTSQVEETLNAIRQEDCDIDLVVYVSRVITPGKITDPIEAIATNAQQFIDAVGEGKKVIYLSGHHLFLVDDTHQQREAIAREIEAFSHAIA